MNRFFRFSSLACACLLILFAMGCGHKIYGLAHTERVRLIGKIKNSPMQGATGVAIHFPRNVLVCKGVLTPGEERPQWGECGGMGVDTIMCTGDIPLVVKWASLNCKQGYAYGEFPSGKVISFSWGYRSHAQASTVMDNIIDIEETRNATSGEKRETPSTKDSSSKPQIIGSGTGFFVSRNGLLVTNNHVIKDAGAVYAYDEVTRQSYRAEILAMDPKNDLAVLKVPLTGRGLPLAAGSVKKGQDIVALGYPVPDVQGNAQKATFGRVNSLTGLLDDVASFQMDASIQPGNSGGPVLNTKGEVVGVSTYTLTTEAKAEYNISGVYYAVKANYVQAILQTLPKEFAPVRADGVARSMPELVERCEPSVVMLFAFDK